MSSAGRTLCVCLLVLSVALAAEPEASESESTTQATESTTTLTTTTEKPTEATTAEATTEKPRQTSTPVDKTNVCHQSFATSSEDDAGSAEKHCACNNIDVDCRYLGISELPQQMTFPKDFHIANFEGNEISDLNADTFYNGRDIMELDLSHNRVDFVSVTAFKGFGRLRNLDLSHNRIWNLPAGALDGLPKLTRLDLSFNDLVQVFPKLFAPLRDLRTLLLESNPLQELQPKHFEHLTKLEHLDLESTLLKVIPDHLFVFTPNLKFLDLSGNQLEEVPTEALHVLDHVRSLDLSGNPVEVVEPEALRGMKGLVILYLDRMPSLTKIKKYAFGDAIQLQELHCSYNFLLTEIDENAFVRKTNNEKVPLSQLFLRQNDLESLSASILNWNDRTELHLRDNPIHCDCKAEWMINLKLKNDFQAQAKCSSPADLADLPLSELKGKNIQCGLQLSEIVMIVCGVATAILIMVMVAAFLTWRRNYRGYSKPYYVPRETINDDIDYRCGEDGM